MDEIPRVAADAALLRLVMSNLLSNALKFSRIRPKAIIEVGGKRENGQCVFWIKDNGIGFGTKSAHKLFKPTFRGLPRQFGGISAGGNRVIRKSLHYS
jgi:signal transduction histidine kinase